ncbi:MAG: RNA pyrophosphohydrolase, partial [Nitratireductor sp.]|nr:RNA pyrophosphohydrolase [Nitratireductor sp.]
IAIDPPPGGHEPEFETWAWRRMEELPGLIVPFKRRVYEKVAACFAHLAGGIPDAGK